MTRSSRPRKASWISDSLNRKLNIYTVAASAAGVGTMALSQAAEAKIVYTPTHVRIAFGQPYGIDFDHTHEGKPDMHLIWTAGNGTQALIASATGGVAYNISYSSNRRPFASAIFAGAKIGPERHFLKQMFGPRMASDYAPFPENFWYGPWANGGKGVKDRYLGIKFKISGKFHYGWTRITVTTGALGFTGMILTGYAYETIPGKAIIAGATRGPDDAEPTAAFSHNPEPATLGALALGLSIWRRDEPVAATSDRI
jgi:hypothetical protein